jgi:hypothetical protein
MSQVPLVSANPDAFARRAFGCGLGVVGIVFFDDADDLLDGKVCLRIPRADAGNTDFADGAVEVVREEFRPFCWIGAGRVNLMQGDL